MENQKVKDLVVGKWYYTYDRDNSLKMVRIRKIYNSQKIAVESKDTDGKFYTTEVEAWKSEDSSYKVEENEEIEVEFNSTDKSAKLYLEALDIIPLHKVGINSDMDGQLYRTPSETPFYLYRRRKILKDRVCYLRPYR